MMTKDPVLTLLSDRFAPVTSAVGFLRLPLEEGLAGLRAWREQLHGAVEGVRLDGELPGFLERLQPLTGGVRQRELLVATVADDWIAYFDCGVQGGDPVSVVGHLSRSLQCQGVVVCSIPHTFGTSLEAPGRYGAVQFELFGPVATDYLNYVRTISLVHDGSRWRFDATGAVQDFEQTGSYSARRLRDRFTSAMAADYCRALGVRPFDSDFYGRRAVLLENPAVVPPGARILDLQATQHWLGIVPGVAERTTG